MKRILPLLALTLAVVFAAAPALAGGEHCAHEAKAAKAAKMAQHGWLGIETEKADQGYRVTAVHDGSPAQAAGFQAGDVLVALNGVRLAEDNKEAVKAAKQKLGVGSQVTYTVERQGRRQQVAATLGPVPEEVLARWMAAEETTRIAAKN